MRWNVKSTYSQEKDVLDQILEDRGILDEKEKEAFLNPKPIFSLLKQLPDEFKENVKIASEMIKEAISQETPIVIHGDYDADGICASAILLKTIREELGYKKAFVFVPNRFEHGYGLTAKSVDALYEKLKNALGDFSDLLLVTVDTGITSVEAVDYAKSLGFTVIITDHHQKPDVLPKSDCLVWCDEVVGSGVSWILAKQLGAKNQSLLGLAALATVTDLQPLFNYNRSIVKEGLTALNENTPVGIKVLREIAGKNEGEITTYDLGWVLGPRLNATGRMGSADLAMMLLMENDEEKARKHAKLLNELNSERQDKTLEMYDLAGSVDEENLPKVIISANNDYHEGIIGLVAAKLAQKYFRPAIVISTGGEVAKGSVRSVPGVDIISFLRNFEDVFENVGGHPMAAGFSILDERIDELKVRAVEFAQEAIDDDFLVPSIHIDLEIPFEMVGLDLARKLEELKPFGIGNTLPVFSCKSVGLSGFDVVGRDGRHLTLKLNSPSGQIRAIYFGGVENGHELEVGSIVDIAFTLSVKKYNGKDQLDMVIKDLKVVS